MAQGGLVHLRCVHFDSGNQQVLFGLGAVFWIHLVQESANLFLKGHSKYFRLWAICFCPNYLALQL